MAARSMATAPMATAGERIIGDAGHSNGCGSHQDDE
jgi:hypothetical protein